MLFEFIYMWSMYRIQHRCAKQNSVAKSREIETVSSLEIDWKGDSIYLLLKSSRHPHNLWLLFVAREGEEKKFTFKNILLKFKRLKGNLFLCWQKHSIDINTLKDFPIQFFSHIWDSIYIVFYACNVVDDIVGGFFFYFILLPVFQIISHHEDDGKAKRLKVCNEICSRRELFPLVVLHVEHFVNAKHKFIHGDVEKAHHFAFLMSSLKANATFFMRNCCVCSLFIVVDLNRCKRQ